MGLASNIAHSFDFELVQQLIYQIWMNRAFCGKILKILVTDRLRQADCSVHGPLIIIKDTEVHIRAGDRQGATR